MFLGSIKEIMPPQTTTKPLLPIADLLSPDISTASSISDKVDCAVKEGLKKVKAGENDRVTRILEDEIAELLLAQEKNNDEIRKRALDLQTLKEKNLVVAGAVSGLRKVLKNVATT
jgi:hypothetical protein